MKACELVHNKEYGLKGQPSKIVTYKLQDGKRFWFIDTRGISFWMNENQIEILLLKL